MMRSGPGEGEDDLPWQGCQNFPLKSRPFTLCLAMGGNLLPQVERGGRTIVPEESWWGRVKHTNRSGASAKTETSQGERTPRVRSRGTVLLEMKHLLLLLQEGKKLKFCSSVQSNHKGKKSRYRGGGQCVGKDFNSCGYTSLDAWVSEKYLSYSSSSAFSVSFIPAVVYLKDNFFRIIVLTVLDTYKQGVLQHLQLIGAGCQCRAVGGQSPAGPGSFAAAAHPRRGLVRSGMEAGEGWGWRVLRV